jgi:hypothetical protein
MLKLKEVPESYNIISYTKKGKTGARLDYSEYIELVMAFVESEKPYMLVEYDDEGNSKRRSDEFHATGRIVSRLRKAIDICELKELVRPGFVSGDGKSHACLYRRDMGY